MPPPLPGIARVDKLRVVGVTTLTRRLSASDHIRQVVGDCSQSLYALHVLRHYGLTDVCLHTVFRSVVVAKLLYACTAWSGFITASDRHHCHSDLPTFNELLEECHDRLLHRPPCTGHLTDGNFITRLHCESKKLCHFYFYCNFGKCWSIFKILSISESERNDS